MDNHELDHEVAKAVMGWKELHDQHHISCEWVEPGYSPLAGLWPPESRYIHGTAESTGFSPSTDWHSAGAVVERLVGAGLEVRVRQSVNKRGFIVAVRLDAARGWEGIDGSAPFALCLAALTASRAGALGGNP